ncbi:MAG: zinc-dependent alcohol dehydrogenase [Acidimicrobiia bacterium]
MPAPRPPASIPATMPAAVLTGPATIEVQQLPTPEVGPTQVLVEVGWCGICGTDLHLALEGYGRPGSVLGHEWSGRVVATGGAVTGIELGAAVVADDAPACGECRPCRRGRPAVCVRRAPPDHLSARGAFARYVVVEADRVLPVPAALDPRAAALTEPVAIALHAMHLADALEPGLRILVTGAGPVGLLMVAVLAAHGVTDVTVSEPSPVRRTRAAALGARRVVEPAELPRAPMGRPVAEPFDLALECSGRATAAESALDQLAAAGTLVFVGTGRDQPRLNHNRMIILELTTLGTYNYDAAGFAPALDLLASGRLPIDLLVEPADVALVDVLPTMHAMAAGTVAAKAMVRPR